MKLRSPWLIKTSAFCAASVARAWLGTVRTRVVSADGRRHPTNPSDERFIYAFWHESLLALAKVRTRVKILVSQSSDGELIALVCKRLGIGTVRGSSTRGGSQGLLELLREGSGSHLALTPDGPRGPRRKVKSGLAFLSLHTGLPVVPIGVGFTKAWRAKSWDRFAVPFPGSLVAGVIGKPLAVPIDLDSAGLEEYRLRIEQAMLEATAAAERWARRLAEPPALAA